MSLLTLDQAIAQCRVEADYPAEQLVPYIDAAVDASQAYLNRNVFETAAALNTAIAAVPGAMGAAQDAYDAAVTAAQAITNAAQQQAMMDIACTQFAQAQTAAARTIAGITVNPSITAAMLLTLGHLFVNREAVGVNTLAETPLGARDLLRPYRLAMMP